MRTSNKILLTGFIATVLSFTGINVALYAKIKRGELVVLRNASQRPAFDRQETPGIKHVRVTGMQECSVIYNDSAHMEIGKNWKENLRWKIEGDTLVIESLGNPNYAMGTRVFVPIELYLPADVEVHGRYTQLFVRGTDDSTKAYSRSLTIENGLVYISPGARGNVPAYWKKLSITTYRGEVSVSPEARMHDMEVMLNDNSTFTDEGAGFGNLLMNVDKTSTISLRGGSLDKLKLIKP